MKKGRELRRGHRLSAWIGPNDQRMTLYAQGSLHVTTVLSTCIDGNIVHLSTTEGPMQTGLDAEMEVV